MRWAHYRDLCSLDSYPYLSIAGHDNFKCRTEDPDFTCEVVIEASVVVDVVRVANSDVALMDAVATQPVAVGVDSSAPPIQHYVGGIIHLPCGSEYTHDVLLVG